LRINEPQWPVELFDRATGSRLYTVDLSALPFAGNFACDPQISPDGRYVSLISNCTGGGNFLSYDFPNEVYLWELKTGALNQISEFAKFAFVGEGEERSGIFASYYQQEWLDARTLLIGVNYPGEARSAAVVTYRVTDGRLMVSRRQVRGSPSTEQVVSLPCNLTRSSPNDLSTNKMPGSKRKLASHHYE
jgi:hypothetical protein